MKSEIFLIFVLLISLYRQENSYTSIITFLNNEITSSGEGVEISGTTVTITNAGSYLVTGTSLEGSVKIKVASVNLYLQNLNLTSYTTAPIIINSNLKNIKIISIENVILNNLEDSSTTTGECAVIKVKKTSQVTFKNQKDFKLNGNCKNIIKGGAQTSLIFESSDGEYIINANQNGISTDDYLKFNGRKFIITTQTGDAIKSSPDDTDLDSMGKIIVNDGSFNIQSYSDAFQAKNNIIIKKGNFNIKTEKGYDSSSFNKDTGSAKGFKVSNNSTGCGIKIYNGDFYLNTPDDSFHSNGNLTIIDGKFIIYSGDDGLHAGFHLLIGKNDSSTTPNINILKSYEAIEGMSIRIYSGKINVTATDDGINSAGGSSSSDAQPRPGPRTNGPGPSPSPGGGGNASYFISIYGGEINVFCDGDGLDTNGNIFIHGGDINVFSQGNKDNEPIDHDGNFTLFNAKVLCVGAKGMEYVHSGILKGNQKYAYYTKSISKNKILTIKNGNSDIVKQGNITKDINYIFYSSSDLDNNHKFYISDTNGISQNELTFSFGNPTSGEDDQDKKSDDGGADTDREDEKSEDEGSSSDDDGKGGEEKKGGDGESGGSTKTFLIYFSIGFILIILIIVSIFLFKKFHSKKSEQTLIKDINKELVNRDTEG